MDQELQSKIEQVLDDNRVMTIATNRLGLGRVARRCRRQYDWRRRRSRRVNFLDGLRR